MLLFHLHQHGSATSMDEPYRTVNAPAVDLGGTLSHFAKILPARNATRNGRTVPYIVTYRRYGGDTPGPQHEHRREQRQSRREHREAKVSPERNVFVRFPVDRKQVAQHALLLVVGLHRRLRNNVLYILATCHVHCDWPCRIQSSLSVYIYVYTYMHTFVPFLVPFSAIFCFFRFRCSTFRVVHSRRSVPRRSSHIIIGFSHSFFHSRFLFS